MSLYILPLKLHLIPRCFLFSPSSVLLRNVSPMPTAFLPLGLRSKFNLLLEEIILKLIEIITQIAIRTTKVLHLFSSSPTVQLLKLRLTLIFVVQLIANRIRHFWLFRLFIIWAGSFLKWIFKYLAFTSTCLCLETLTCSILSCGVVNLKRV